MGSKPPDRHANAREAFTVRPPPGTKEAARRELAERDLELHSLIVACILAVADSPDGVIRLLAPYWPPRKRGRPRKDSK